MIEIWEPANISLLKEEEQCKAMRSGQHGPELGLVGPAVALGGRQSSASEGWSLLPAHGCQTKIQASVWPDL